MKNPRRDFRCLKVCVTLLVAMAPAAYAPAQAAESNKIHVVGSKYGDFLADKTCVPDLKHSDGTAKCVVEVTDALCKSGAKPAETKLEVIWDCGELKHAGGAPRSKKVTLTCPYVPGLN